MTFFLDENGLSPIDAPRELLRALSFHGSIVKAASSHPANTEFSSIVLCRRRPDHKPCGFMLTVTHGLDGVIRWGCPGCGEQGYISNWQGTILRRLWASTWGGTFDSIHSSSKRRIGGGVE